MLVAQAGMLPACLARNPKSFDDPKHVPLWEMLSSTIQQTGSISGSGAGETGWSQTWRPATLKTEKAAIP